MATVKMVTTGDLLFAGNDGKKYKFILPAYQRGYRWRSPENNDVNSTENSQILQLLVDIKEYLEKDAFERKFYCLQPVVVAKTPNDEYYLVDGQQRLTTFYLLYKYLKYDNICSPEYRDVLPQEVIDKKNVELNKSVFALEYENNRQGVSVFLNSIQRITGICHDSIDQYFLSSAYLCIQNWFQEHPKLKSEFLQLLERKEAEINVPAEQKIPRSLQFIWYELEGDECKDQEKLFQRINKGKIPLTSAELIKAFLFGEFDKAINSSEKLARDKERFEKEWEEYENAMQDDAFWCFISRDNYDTRLEYLFELLLSENTEGAEKEKLCCGQNVDNPQHTFALFKKMYDGKYKGPVGDIAMARQDFFEHYQKLRKYYRDWELYHLIGCLIHLKVRMDEICRLLAKLEQIGAASIALRKRILEKLFTNKVQTNHDLRGELSSLRYDGKPDLMRDVLLVFNIATMLKMQQKRVFFAFDQYHHGSWDLEHICSQNQEIDNNKKDQWLDTILEYFGPSADGNEETQKKFERLLEHPKEAVSIEWENLEKLILCGIQLIKNNKLTKDKAWSTIFDLVNRYERRGADEPMDATHTLHNITLLDSKTNRAYKDAPFFVKRKYIISVEENGRFILPGTRNVFLKTYSKALDNMLFWDPKTDGENYFNKLCDTLADFFSLPSEAPEKAGEK